MNRRTYLAGIGAVATPHLAGFISSSTPVQSSESGQQWHGTYSGTAQVETQLVEYVDDRISGYRPQSAATIPATVVLDRPLTTAINTEDNPLSVVAQSSTSPAMGVEDGDFFISSSRVFSTTDYPEPSVVQAWRLQLQGNELSGTLERNADIVSNYFFVTPDWSVIGVSGPYRFPYGMGIRATLTAEGISGGISLPDVGTEIRLMDQVAYAAQVRMDFGRQ